MRDKQVFLKEILGEIVEFLVLGAQTVGGRDAGDAGELMHILQFFIEGIKNRL